jgi:hypothetical protein
MGIGAAELLIILLIGVLTIGIPLAIVLLLVFLLPKWKDRSGDTTLVAQLREENQRLRDELARLRNPS